MKPHHIPWIKSTYTVIGLMSGTSLDGLDMVWCRLTRNETGWSYKILEAKTEPYPENIRKRLATAQEMNGNELAVFHNEYGLYLGARVRSFLDENRHSCDLVASHGHTIFHVPEEGLTLQVGNGLHIARETGLLTVFDFRTQDVVLGGQGAPLVPIGDQLLFGDYEYCLNLGGFSNISYEQNGVRMAFDPSPVNYVINHCARQSGQPFDRDGRMARKGLVHYELLDELNALEYYRIQGPKSLGREWVEERFLPILERFDLPPEDRLRTIYEHIAFQIGESLNVFEKGRLLVTGGGTYNRFLMALLEQKLKHQIVIPSPEIIDFK